MFSFVYGFAGCSELSVGGDTLLYIFHDAYNIDMYFTYYVLCMNQFVNVLYLLMLWQYVTISCKQEDEQRILAACFAAF